MATLRIYLDNAEADYTAARDYNIEIWRAATTAATIGKTSGAYTTTIRLPLTARNSRLLRLPQSLSSIIATPRVMPARIEVDGHVVIAGTFRLNAVDLDANTANGNIISNAIDWAAAIGKKTLREIESMPAIPFWGMQTILARNAATSPANPQAAGPVTFPMVSYGNFFMPDKYTPGNSIGVTTYNPSDGFIDLDEPIAGADTYVTNRASNAHFDIGDYPGAVFVTHILRAIFADIGIQVGGSIFESDEFRRLAVLHTSQSGPQWPWSAIGRPSAFFNRKPSTPAEPRRYSSYIAARYDEWGGANRLVFGATVTGSDVYDGFRAAAAQAQTYGSYDGLPLYQQFMLVQHPRWLRLSDNHAFAIPNDTNYIAPATGRYTFTVSYDTQASYTVWNLQNTQSEQTYLRLIGRCDTPRVALAAVVGDPADWQQQFFDWARYGQYTRGDGNPNIFMDPAEYSELMDAIGQADGRMAQLQAAGIVPFLVDLRQGQTPTGSGGAGVSPGQTIGVYSWPGTTGGQTFTVDLEAGQALRLVVISVGLDTAPDNDFGASYWNQNFGQRARITNEVYFNEITMRVDSILKEDSTPYPTQLNPAMLLPDTIQQIDFVKDIFTLFNITALADTSGVLSLDSWQQAMLPFTEAYDLTGKSAARTGLKTFRDDPAAIQYEYTPDGRDDYWPATGLNANLTVPLTGNDSPTIIKTIKAAPTAHARYDVVVNTNWLVPNGPSDFNNAVQQVLASLWLPTIASQDALDRPQNDPQGNSLDYALHLVRVDGYTTMPEFTAIYSRAPFGADGYSGPGGGQTTRYTGIPHRVWSPQQAGGTDSEVNQPYTGYPTVNSYVAVSFFSPPATGPATDGNLAWPGNTGLYQRYYQRQAGLLTGSYQLEVDIILSPRDYTAIQGGRRPIILDDVMYYLAGLKGYSPLTGGHCRLTLTKI